MPRINMENHQLGGGGNFTFSGARIDKLSASEYTLATIAVDLTGSTSSFIDQLEEMIKLAVNGCRSSPRSENLLVRVLTFNSNIGVQELHGFKPLAEIDADKDYTGLRAVNFTNLYDAVYSAVGAANVYGQQLQDQNYGANAVTFIITDGEDNASTVTPAMIAAEIDKSVTGEVLESHVTVLIGINADECRASLESFQREAKITQYTDAGAATRGNLAKLAQFVSKSVSSASQALVDPNAPSISASI